MNHWNSNNYSIAEREKIVDGYLVEGISTKELSLKFKLPLPTLLYWINKKQKYGTVETRPRQKTRLANHPMDFKMKVVEDFLNGSESVQDVADRYGIKRTTLYNWIQARNKFKGTIKEKEMIANKGHSLGATIPLQIPEDPFELQFKIFLNTIGNIRNTIVSELTSGTPEGEHKRERYMKALAFSKIETQKSDDSSGILHSI